jgi:hypothetical protein
LYPYPITPNTELLAQNSTTQAHPDQQPAHLRGSHRPRRPRSPFLAARAGALRPGHRSSPPPARLPGFELGSGRTRQCGVEGLAFAASSVTAAGLRLGLRSVSFRNPWFVFLVHRREVFDLFFLGRVLNCGIGSDQSSGYIQ